MSEIRPISETWPWYYDVTNHPSAMVYEASEDFMVLDAEDMVSLQRRLNDLEARVQRLQQERDAAVKALDWLYTAANQAYIGARWWARPSLFWPWVKRPRYKVIAALEDGLASAEETLEIANLTATSKQTDVH